MKKIILSIALVAVFLGVQSSLMAKPQMCYTHPKKWHVCPMQPSK